jgi:tetratricopeptide (TPR) repeat protein
MNKWMLIGILFFGGMLAGLIQVDRALAADAVGAAKYEAAGNQLYQSGDFAKAVQYFQTAVQLDPSRTASFVGLGNSQYRLDHKTEALGAYEKAVALDPTNAQLTQFVNTLKGGPATAPISSDDPAKQAGDLFAQKRYVEAIPLFELAAEKDPSNPRIQYYMAYACSMTGDLRGAALHFYRFNAISPNAGVQAYADRIKNGLSPVDQKWVDDQLSGSATPIAPKSYASKKVKKYGIRLVPALCLPAQSSLKSYAQGVTAKIATLQINDPTLGGEVTVPTGYLAIQLEPFCVVSPKLELGLSLGYCMVGHLKTNTYDNTFTSENDIKFTAMSVGLVGRYFFSKPEKKARPFLGLGLLFAAVKSDSTTTVNYPDFPELNTNASASGNASAFGGEIQLGLDYALSPSIHAGPIVGYRVMKATNIFTADSSGSAPSLDLGGPMVGLMLTGFF